MAPTNIWGSTRAIQNKSLSCGWLILRGCGTQGLRPPGTMITTANIIKVSENIYIAPMNVIRRRNCKDNAPKLNPNLYNIKLDLMLQKVSNSFQYTLLYNSAHRIHRTLKIYACSHYHHKIKLESFEN